MNRSWRLIDSGFQTAAYNMSFDGRLFEEALSAGDFSPALRIYGFRHPAVTCGYSQKDLAQKIKTGIESAFRITGGGLVFHGTDFTYAVIASRAHHPGFASIETSYRIFHEIIREAFAKGGIETELFKGGGRRAPGGFCFTNPVRNDVMFKAEKVAGAAEKRSKGIFLHQGTVELAPFLKEGAGYLSFYEKFKQWFLEAFRAYFGTEFVIESGPVEL